MPGRNYAYVMASYAARLTVVDVSNPLQPTITAAIQPVDVKAANGFAYLADKGSKGPLTVVDVHNPASPRVRG